MKRVDAHAKRILVLALSGRDGAIAQNLLTEAGFESHICADLPDMVKELNAGAAAAIITEESVVSANVTALASWIQDQPTWSDFPIILLSRHGGGVERNPLARRWADVLGNVTLIERPFHPTTLTATVASASRARHRQYQARARADELAEGQEQLRTAMRAADLGAWRMVFDGMVLEASPASKAHYGRGPEDDFDFEAFKASIYPEDWHLLEETTRRTISNPKGDYWVTYRVRWPDGSTHWVDGRGQAVGDSNGRVIGLVGVTADITKRRTAELEREQLLADIAELNASLEQRVVERTNELMVEVAAREKAQEQLRQAQKMESIGQLTGGVAHDFNNLLMAVMSALTLLRKRITPTPQISQLLDGATQAAERGAALTQRLLAFSRQQDLMVLPVDIGALVGGMEDLVERSLGPLFTLSIKIDEALPSALADRNQLELAILNLAINARDAMPEGGEISLSVARAVRDVPATGRSAYLAIAVADTGTGMDAATLERAIEPFFSTKAVGKGTGLGLSMVHGLAVQSGGMFTLQSEPGKGTTATIFVPIASHNAEIKAVAAATQQDVAALDVLVVDDDELVAELTSGMLQELGHRVTVFHSGREAISYLETQPAVDLLVTDYLMPIMTGREVVAAARELRPDLPILMATGFAEDADTLPTDIPRIAKPYDLQALQGRLSEMFGG